MVIVNVITPTASKYNEVYKLVLINALLNFELDGYKGGHDE